MIDTWTFDTSGQPTTARLYAAATVGVGGSSGGAAATATLLFAPGAGASHDHRFNVALASALAERGTDTITFNFPYAEAGRRRPDPPRILEQTWLDAVASVTTRPRVGSQPLFIGGKSMGGRLASQVAAAHDLVESRLAGIVCVGYPLQPPGRPAPRAVDHFTAIRVPMLMLQGTRDAFGGPEAVSAAARAAGANPQIVAIDGADHGFAVPRRTGMTAADVVAVLADHITSWMADVLRSSVAERRVARGGV